MQTWLVVVATVLTLLGFIFAGQDLSLTPAPWGFVQNGDTEYPLMLGVISFTHLGFFLGFLFLYLNFEFYGFRSGFYPVIALSLTMIGVFFLYGLMNKLSAGTPIAYYDRRLFSMFLLDERDMLATVTAYAVGFSVIFSVASALKRLTRNYFMFFRFPIATAIGLALFVALQTLLSREKPFVFNTSDLQVLFIERALTPAVQFAVFIVGAVIPLYLLRLFLGMFRGKAEAEPVAPATPAVVATNAMPLSKPSRARRLVVTPLLFALVLGGLCWLTPAEYQFRVFKHVPDLFGLTPPMLSMSLSVATLGFLAMATLKAVPIGIIGLFHMWRDRRRAVSASKTDANMANQTDEDTVSEKVDPRQSTA